MIDRKAELEQYYIQLLEKRIAHLESTMKHTARSSSPGAVSSISDNETKDDESEAMKSEVELATGPMLLQV